MSDKTDGTEVLLKAYYNKCAYCWKDIILSYHRCRVCVGFFMCIECVTKLCHYKSDMGEHTYLHELELVIVLGPRKPGANGTDGDDVEYIIDDSYSNSVRSDSIKLKYVEPIEISSDSSSDESVSSSVETVYNMVLSPQGSPASDKESKSKASQNEEETEDDLPASE